MNALLKIPSFDGTPIAVTESAIEKRDEIISVSSTIIQVSNGQQLQLSVNSRQALKAFIAECDAFCEKEKRPFYDTYKKILAMTEELKLAAINEDSRLKRLNDGYATAEARRVVEETRRQEQERQAAEKKVQDALDEQTRIANLKKPSMVREIAAENKVIESVAQLQQVQTKAPATVTRAAGMRIRTVLKFEITDRKALYAARPEFFELVEKKSVINASIQKDTVLPGLKVWEAIET